VTTPAGYHRAYHRELRRREADGTLAAWRPLRIGSEREEAPRWFTAAVRNAKRVGTH
jgi:hypothetical protein